MSRTRWEIEDGKYPCPHRAEGCEAEPFESLYFLKKHLTEAHGGFTTGDLGDSVKESREDKEDEPTDRQPTPKRSNKRNRELNEKANRALRLGIRSILSGMTKLSPLTAEEQAELASASDEISSAALGVEFDFENTKLVRVAGRFWLVMLLVFLSLVPFVPDIKETIGKARSTPAAEPDALDDPQEHEKGPVQ